MLEIYVSTDVETDGPVASKHSILSIGSAAFTAEKEMLSTFSANLETLPNAPPDSKTAAWWLTQPQAWSACRQNLEPPREAMTRYVTWLKSLPGKPVFVAYPTAFDFPFVYWYLTEFVGENPFGYSAIDIKTYSMALMRKPYRMCGKRSMPSEWLDAVPHTHVALRAGLRALNGLPDRILAEVVATIENVKTGRPLGRKKAVKGKRRKKRRSSGKESRAQ